VPTPRNGESRNDFISRCVPIVVGDGTAGTSQQAVAVCNSIWEQRTMSDNDILLKAIQDRISKRTEFGRGILTADKHVRRMLDVIGLSACYKAASTEQVSFDDVLKKAASMLVYSNEDMEEVEDVYDKAARNFGLKEEVKLPKNTLMVFRHVLTSSKKDRDLDILRSEGAEVDPKMLLLWQHVHTLPIGKMIGVAKQTKKNLTLVSAIVDLNELAHDAAVMIDNNMGRFSHGFRALEFEPIKNSSGEEEGFDVKRFEIMEESLVSVPANPDAEIQDVLLSLIEGDKLTSDVMKEYGKTIREAKPVMLPVNLDLKVSVNGQEVKNEDESGIGKKEGRENKTGSSKQKDGDETKANKAGDNEGLKIVESIKSMFSSEKTVIQLNVWTDEEGKVQMEENTIASNEPEEKEVGIKDVIAFIPRATEVELKQMKDVVDMLIDVHERQKKTERYLAIRG